MVEIDEKDDSWLTGETGAAGRAVGSKDSSGITDGVGDSGRTALAGVDAWGLATNIGVVGITPAGCELGNWLDIVAGCVVWPNGGGETVTGVTV